MKLEQALQTKFKNEKYKSLLNVMYTSNWIKNMHDKVFQSYNITISQFNILRILNGARKKESFLTMNQIKSRMIDKTPNTTRLVNSLLQKEFISRKRSLEDRRVVYVEITEKGIKTVKEMTRKLDQEVKVIETLTEEEYVQLNELLDKFRPE